MRKFEFEPGHVRKVLNGGVSYLDGAFYWHDSPEGHCYWYEQRKRGYLTAEARLKLERMLEEHEREKNLDEARKQACSDNRSYFSWPGEPKKPELDLTKPVQTRDGRPVRILCTDAKGESPVVALVTEDDGEEDEYRYDLDGSTDGWSDNCAPVNVPEPEIERWVNVYVGGNCGEYVGGTYGTKEEADKQASFSTRLACVPIRFRKGDGL